MTCHNRVESTLFCLNNLYLQEGLDRIFCIEIFLVDDGSTDDTASKIRHYYPNVKIISGDGNLYWNKGTILAWKNALKEIYDFFIWLNDDTYLFPYAVQELLISSENLNNGSIICGSIESLEVNGEFAYGGCKYIGNTYFKNIPNGTIENADLINGNCVLIPFQVYSKVGTLDPFFIHAIADNDYGLRAKRLGIKSYSTGNYIGQCSTKNSLPLWCKNDVKLIERIKNLYSPLGNSHPYYFFIYEKRHFGLIRASKHFFSIHIRLFFPQLWKH